MPALFIRTTLGCHLAAVKGGRFLMDHIASGVCPPDVEDVHAIHALAVVMVVIHEHNAE